MVFIDAGPGEEMGKKIICRQVQSGSAFFLDFGEFYC